MSVDGSDGMRWRGVGVVGVKLGRVATFDGGVGWIGVER